MPTLVVLDTSLSMVAPFACSSASEGSVAVGDGGRNRSKLVLTGLTHLFQCLKETNCHEFVGLAAFNHEAEFVKAYTRDYPSIIVACTKLEYGSKTNLAAGLQAGHSPHAGSIWSSGVLCQMKLPSSTVELFHELVELNGQTAADQFVHFVDDLQSTESRSQLVKQLLGNMVSRFYAPTRTSLRCGCFAEQVQLTPSLVRADLAAVEIVGFLRLADLANAPVASRHLLLPSAQNDGQSDENVPNFCVLLHGSLKVEKMVALCRLGVNWFGAVYHLPDSKKSNLTLNCFEQGDNFIPWLGNLTHLTCVSSQVAGNNKAAFPVAVWPKPSYATAPQTCCWIAEQGLQADMQKILRYSKRLPERQSLFYSELNRVVSHALCLGFVNMIERLAELLEKEAHLASSSLEMKKHVLHVVNTLHETKELKYNSGKPISPPVQ